MASVVSSVWQNQMKNGHLPDRAMRVRSVELLQEAPEHHETWKPVICDLDSSFIATWHVSRQYRAVAGGPESNQGASHQLATCGANVHGMVVVPSRHQYQETAYRSSYGQNTYWLEQEVRYRSGMAVVLRYPPARISSVRDTFSLFRPLQEHEVHCWRDACRTKQHATLTQSESERHPQRWATLSTLR